MRYQQQKNSPGCLVHKPQCLPTLLKVHHAISDEHTPLVVKDLTGLFEADAVLALIGEVLRLVPFETNSAHYSNIITYMALCNRGFERCELDYAPHAGSTAGCAENKKLRPPLVY